jgi:hypothetical protein
VIQGLKKSSDGHLNARTPAAAISSHWISDALPLPEYFVSLDFVSDAPPLPESERRMAWPLERG